MIGDAAMICFASPRDAVAGTKRLIDVCMREPSFPIPRAGLHHGQARERGGDFIGNTVNVAARVASQAAGGHTLATATVAAAARLMGVDVVDLGCFDLHNLSERVELFEIEMYTASDGTPSSIQYAGCRCRAFSRCGPIALRRDRVLVLQFGVRGNLRNDPGRFAQVI